jgi:thiol-disulfide isomerase/thioredoxin
MSQTLKRNSMPLIAMNLFEKYAFGLRYNDFLSRYATDGHKHNWSQAYNQVVLTPGQKNLLAGFKRQMPVLCLAGAWCGDCSGQCPIFEHFAQASPLIQVRYLDRDDHTDVQQVLQINGGNRVPVLVFFSEDGYEVARYGERTLAKYRRMMGAQPISESLLHEVIQDWLNEFERVQYILRLSARLRKVHGD